jgi:mono/diheme cytochrome c family protein
MSPVVHAGLAAVPDGDVRALALYFADIGHAADSTPAVEAAVGRALALSPDGGGLEYDPGARLYAGACIACHYNARPVPLAARPELALNSALTLDEPTNFIRTVLEGIGAADGAPGLLMPAYAAALTDDDIASLAAYLRRTRTDQPAWSNLKAKVSTIRRETGALK